MRLFNRDDLEKLLEGSRDFEILNTEEERTAVCIS